MHIHQCNIRVSFSEDEINDIIKSPKNSGFEISSNKGKLIVRLTNEREDVLRSKIKDKTIDDYIVEFETLFSISAKELIYKFLYELFSNDVGSFQKLINAKNRQRNNLGLIHKIIVIRKKTLSIIFKLGATI